VLNITTVWSQCCASCFELCPKTSPLSCVKDGTLLSPAPRHGHGLFHGATDAMGYWPGKVTQTDAMYAANLNHYLGPLFTSSPLQTSIANDLKKDGLTNSIICFNAEFDTRLSGIGRKIYRKAMYLLNPLFSYSTKLIPSGNIGMYYVDCRLTIFPVKHLLYSCVVMLDSQRVLTNANLRGHTLP